MVDKHALFFQLAAALIPALLFGGLATDRLTPPKALRSRAKGRLVLLGLVVALLFALAAEWFAIELSFAEDPALWKVPIVVFTLVAATAALAGALLYPWLKVVWPQATGLVFSILALAATFGNVALSHSVYEALLLTEVRRAEQLDDRLQRRNEDRRRDYVEMQSLIDEQAKLRDRRDLTATDRRLYNRILEQRLLGLVDDAVAERKGLEAEREALERRAEYPDAALPPP